ncbi:MAG TPA: biliverdin-producing heme oxygenase [Longimicrobium sp.]
MEAVTRPAILDLLRDRTRAAHDRAEEALPLLDPSLDAARYRAILAGFWGFHAALEPRLAAVAELRGLGLDPTERRKLPRLEHDLRTLGADPARLSLADAVPEVEGVAAALGCMYVLEGATLGGRVISRHLAARGIGPESGGAFFAGYGDETGEMWKSFSAAIGAYAEAHPESIPRIVDAADETFTLLERWLARTQHDPPPDPQG